MNPFPRQTISLRREEGGRKDLLAECGFGLAIVPVDVARLRLAPSPTDGRGGGDRMVQVSGFALFHIATGMQLLPEGWIFDSADAARAALAAIGARWPHAFEARDINLFMPLGGPVMTLARAMGVQAGKWADLSAALDGIDEDEWAAGAEDRQARMLALRDHAGNIRRNAEAA